MVRAIKKQRGFTIMELIVVIAVTGILASVVIANVGEGRKKARDAQRINDIEQIRLALRLYKEENGSYPNFDNGVEIGIGGAIDAMLAPHMSGVPKDPLTDSNVDYNYYYDSDITCNFDGGGNTDHVIIYATAMEMTPNANFSTVCQKPGNGSGSVTSAGSPNGAAFGINNGNAYGKILGGAN